MHLMCSINNRTGLCEVLSNSGMFEYFKIAPYGSNECIFGESEARMCYQKLANGNSWANTGVEECQNCRIKVSPHHQDPWACPPKKPTHMGSEQASRHRDV